MALSAPGRQGRATVEAPASFRAHPGSLDSRSACCVETPEHEADHREAHESRCCAGVALVVAGQPPTAADPGECSLHNPPLREHHEAVPVAAAHDVEHPCARPGHDRLHLAALIACIRNDALQKGKAPARLSEQPLGPIPILHAGGMHGDREQQAERIGQDVALAASDLLARVIPGRVERGPPLRAPRTLWLSMMAVVGLASRPAFSLTSTYRAWWMRLSVPSHAHRSKYSQTVLRGGKSLGSAFHGHPVQST